MKNHIGSIDKFYNENDVYLSIVLMQVNSK